MARLTRPLVHCLVISVAASLGFAHAATRYVGTGEGYATIQSAIDASSDGDMIIVRDGTYTGTGNRDIDFKGKAIHLKSENGPDTCIVDCEGSEAERDRAGYHGLHHQDRSKVSLRRMPLLVQKPDTNIAERRQGAGLYCVLGVQSAVVWTGRAIWGFCPPQTHLALI